MKPKWHDSVLPKHCLHIDNSFGIGHVVLLSTHCALLVHDHQIISIYNATLQQAVQTGGSKIEQSTDVK